MLQNSDLELVAAIHGDIDEALPIPFEQDIFLLGIPVAGAYYAPNIEALFEAIQEGDQVKLIREPDNEYDEYAVRLEVDENVLASMGEEYNRKIGYIPRSENKVFARLLDAGKDLYGIVRLKEDEGNYYKIVVKIYMKD